MTDKDVLLIFLGWLVLVSLTCVLESHTMLMFSIGVLVGILYVLCIQSWDDK